jgi:hypothetical protein
MNKQELVKLFAVATAALPGLLLGASTASAQVVSEAARQFLQAVISARHRVHVPSCRNRAQSAPTGRFSKHARFCF